MAQFLIITCVFHILSHTFKILPSQQTRIEFHFQTLPVHTFQPDSARASPQRAAVPGSHGGHYYQEAPQSAPAGIRRSLYRPGGRV